MHVIQQQGLWAKIIHILDTVLQNKHAVYTCRFDKWDIHEQYILFMCNVIFLHFLYLKNVNVSSTTDCFICSEITDSFFAVVAWEANVVSGLFSQPSCFHLSYVVVSVRSSNTG